MHGTPSFGVFVHSSEGLFVVRWHVIFATEPVRVPVEVVQTAVVSSRHAIAFANKPFLTEEYKPRSAGMHRHGHMWRRTMQARKTNAIGPANIYSSFPGTIGQSSITHPEF